jgi:hypothetical protein
LKSCPPLTGRHQAAAGEARTSVKKPNPRAFPAPAGDLAARAVMVLFFVALMTYDASGEN